MNLGWCAICWFILLLKLSWWPCVSGKKWLPFCPSALRVSTLYFPPFVLNSSSGDPKGIMGDFFMDTLDNCVVKMCAPNVTLENITFEMFYSTEAFASWIRDNKSDLFFPIARPLKVALSGDDYTGPALDFRTVLSSPKYSLIKDVEIYNKEAKIIVLKTLFENAWPIVVFTVLIAGISGVCVWILETYYNEEEFPRSFIQGTYEGFWWAFVTMTTVGYGDKTPRFIFGRLFGVLWILTGLVVIAMFTATTTGALSISSAGLPGIQGIHVGVLPDTSAELVAKQNGAKVKLLAPFDDLYDALKRQDIDGILLDGYRAAYYLDHKNDPSVRVFQNLDSEIQYSFAAPSAILSMMTDHESCFKRHIEYLHVDHLLMRYLKPIKAYRPEIDSESLVSGESRSTRDFLLVTMGIFFGLILLGTLTELVYKKVWRPSKRIHDGHEDVKLKEIRIHPDTTKANLKEVKDKIVKLICEVGKLQEQVSAIASQGDGKCGSEETTSNMKKGRLNEMITVAIL